MTAYKIRVFVPQESITKTCLFKYIENFTTKTEPFQIKKKKKAVIFFIFLDQNIDCGYSLEPRRGGSNEYPQSVFEHKQEK